MMRRRIAYKLAAIWIAVALPLVLILVASYVDRYQSRVDFVENERVSQARLAAFAFHSLITNSQRTMTALGSHSAVVRDSDIVTTAQFAEAAQLYPATYIAMLDQDGKVLAASDAKMLGTDLSHIQAFAMAPFSPAGGAVEPVTIQKDGKPGFHVAQQIKSARGSSPRIMVMRVDLKRLHEEYPLDVAQGGISIIDSWGQVVFESEDSSLALTRQRWGDRFPSVKKAIDGTTSTTRDFRLSPGGEQRIAAFVPITPWGWAAGSTVSIDEGLGTFWSNLNLNLTMALGASVVGLLLAMVLSMNIGRALSRLSASAARLGESDFTEPVDVRRSDEIGVVAQALEKARRGLLRYQAENETLFARQQEVSDLNGALAEIEAVMHSTLAFSEVLTRVLEMSAGAVECEAAGINLLEGDYWVRAALLGFPDRFLGEVVSQEQTTVATIAAGTGKPVVVNDVSADPRLSGWFAEHYGVKSVMAFPLFSKGRVFGVLFYDNLSEAITFSDAQIEFAQKVSNSLSLAYENARLYQAEHDVAEQLQGALLALPERVPGIEHAVRYQAASDVARVGGDFYDLFTVDGKVCITVGDVSGHGVDAAVVTSLVKTAVRVAASEGHDPARALAVANNVLYNDSPTEIFATVVFATLDLASGVLCYANAGHTPGAIISAIGVQRLDANSTIVGAFPDIEFSVAEARMELGDVLFLYTDGIVEARGAEGFYGIDRLFELLRTTAGSDPELVASTVLDEVGRYTGGKFADDVAILALRRTEVEPERDLR